MSIGLALFSRIWSPPRCNDTLSARPDLFVPASVTLTCCVLSLVCEFPSPVRGQDGNLIRVGLAPTGSLVGRLVMLLQFLHDKVCC